MTLRFRPMKPQDVPAAVHVRLATVENAVTLQELAEDYGVTPASMEEALRSDARGWICEDAGCAVGFSMGDGLTGEVTVVAVMPDHENRGIGKTVFGHVRDWLFSLGHSEIWLLANPDTSIRATGFYEKLGWQASGVMRGQDQVLKLRRIVTLHSIQTPADEA